MTVQISTEGCDFSTETINPGLSLI